tara:strand:- start:1394 stop:2575 length:1182 start_codon:yes stop_codon:yes gene_type:complete
LNILHISTFLQGGAGKVVIDLAVDAMKRGHSATIVCTENSIGDYGNYESHIQQIKKERIPLLYLNSTFSRELFLNIKAAKNLMIQGVLSDIDLIHSHASIPSLVSIMASSSTPKKIPILQTMHGWGIYKNKRQEKQDVTILNLVDHVVTISESSRNLLVSKGVGKNHCSVIYNGITKSDSCNKLENDEDLTCLNRFKKEGFKIIGIVGTVDKRKNQEILLKALLLLPREIKIKAFIVGEGKTIPVLEKFCEINQLNDTVHFTGYKKNGRDFIRSLDLLLSTSLSEGGPPISVIEALAENIPVVASMTPEHIEVIENQKNGFLYNYKDAKNLADTIINALNHNNLKEITEKAKESFQEKFVFSKTRNLYLELYNKMVGNPSLRKSPSSTSRLLY